MILIGVLLAMPACLGDTDPHPLSGDQPLSIATEDLFTIGGLDAPEWASFDRVDRIRVAFDGQGRLFILDRSRHRVVVLTTAGELDHEMGRAGEGPGEFRTPMALKVAADGTVVVYDYGRRSMIHYDTNGEHLTDIPLQYSPIFGSPLAHTVGFVSSGYPGGSRPRQEEGEAIRTPLSLLDADQGTIHELYRAWRPAPLPSTRETVAGMTVTVPALSAFRPPLSYAVLLDGRIALSDSVTYRIRIISDSGTVVGEIGRSILPLPVDEALRNAERERRSKLLSQRAASRGVPSSGGDVALVRAPQDTIETRRLEERRIESMIFPDELAVIEALAVDYDGRLWVARTGDLPGNRGPIDILSAEGEYLGTILAGVLEIPDAFGPDGLGAYVEEGELEVPVVRIVRFRGLPNDL